MEINMDDLTPKEYIINIFQKFLKWKIEESISKILNTPVIKIPSIEDAICLSCYGEIIQLTGRFKGVRLIEPLESHIFQEKIPEFYGEFPIRIPLLHPLDQNYIQKTFELFKKPEEKFLIVWSCRTNGVTSKTLRQYYRKNILELFDKLSSLNYLWENFLFLKLPINREFYVPESLFEFFSGMFFKHKGFLVTKWGNGVTADIYAFKIPELFEANGGKGMFLLELFLETNISLVEKLRAMELKVEESIVIEAESSPTRAKSYSSGSGYGQLREYTSIGYFDKGFVAGPLCFEKDEEFGTVSFKEDGSLFFDECKKNHKFNNELNEAIIKLFKWFFG